MFMFYSIRNIDSTCTRPLDLIGYIYLYIFKLGCFLNICTHVTYTNQIIREIVYIITWHPFHHPGFPQHTIYIGTHITLCARVSAVW